MRNMARGGDARRALAPLPNGEIKNTAKHPARQAIKRKHSDHAMQRQNIALRREISSQLSSARVVVGLKQTECAGLRERILMRGHDRLSRVDNDVLHQTHLPDTPDALRAAVASPASLASPPPDEGRTAQPVGGAGASTGSALGSNAGSKPDTPNTLNATLRSVLSLAEARHREASTAMDRRLHLLQLKVREMSPRAPAPALAYSKCSTPERAGSPARSALVSTAVPGAEASSSPGSAAPGAPLYAAVTAQRQHRPGWMRTDGSFVVYSIKICAGARSEPGVGGSGSEAIVVAKRFSALLRCHQRLAAALQASRCTAAALRLLHAFPPREMKLLVDHLDPAFVERRRGRLELYVRAVALAFQAKTPQQLAQLFNDEADEAATVLL